MADSYADDLPYWIKVGDKEGDPERIRAWLKANYKVLGLKWVLLIGNPDPNRPGVPMKSLTPGVSRTR